MLFISSLYLGHTHPLPISLPNQLCVLSLSFPTKSNLHCPNNLRCGDCPGVWLACQRSHPCLNLIFPLPGASKCQPSVPLLGDFILTTSPLCRGFLWLKPATVFAYGQSAMSSHVPRAHSVRRTLFPWQPLPPLGFTIFPLLFPWLFLRLAERAMI